MPVHLHGFSMFRHYFKYFMGAYQPVTDMRGMPIVRKYDIHAKYQQSLNGTIDMQ
jgi:hypothetical protein